MDESEFLSKDMSCTIVAAPSPPPETVQFQIIYALFEDEKTGLLRKWKEPFLNKDAAEIAAQDLMLKSWSVQDAFVCTVHAAYSKEQNIKKVI